MTTTTLNPPRDRAAEAAWLRLGREITERAREIAKARKGR